LESSEGIVYLEGYYNNIEIKNIDASRITNLNLYFNENGDWVKCSSFKTNCETESNAFVITNELNKKGNVFDCILYIFSYELNRPCIKDILFFVLIIVIGVFAYFSFRGLKKHYKNKDIGFFKLFLKNLGVFGLGVVFWSVVFIFLLEIVLRIAGFVYSEKQPKYKIHNDDNKFVILCIGDSFTYGIGSTKGNDYPALLQSIMQEYTEQEVIVINRGRCAQNTTQTIEKLQEDLNSCHPDLVVMLFGMANSWNYYGFDNANSYFERIRVVKLFKRITYNIKYKDASSDTEQKVEDFAYQFMLKSLNYPKFGSDSYNRFYYAGRYYLALRDWENAFLYLSHSLYLKQGNLDCYNALEKCLHEFDIECFYNEMSGDFSNTVVPKTLVKLNEFIEKYSNAVVFEYLKLSYLKEKSGTEIHRELLFLHLNTILAENGFVFDIVPLVETAFENDFDSISAFYNDIKTVDNSSEIDIAFVWLNLSHNNIEGAKNMLSQISLPSDELNLKLYMTANAIIKILDEDDLLYNEYVDKERIVKLKDAFITVDSGGYQMRILFKALLYDENSMEQYYFLPHQLKRTSNIDQPEIFEWIKSDIEKAVEICIKQNYPVICMNYPIIPPPNSEEVSFWADSVGNIWKQTAQKYNLLFVNNDSVFKSKGDSQNDYFEPHGRGSEHCSDKGYKLMAESIAVIISRNYNINN